jgi:predicted metal-dependent hydrolase
MENRHSDYLLVKSAKRKKTICLQVRRDGAVVVQAPVHTSKKEIERFLEEKQGWLKKRLREQKIKEWECREKSFTDGETFLFLGKTCPLKILNNYEYQGNRAPLIFSNGCFVLRADFVSQGKALLKAWYWEKAGEHFAERVRSFSMTLSSFPAGIRLSHAQTRWGSCSADNRLFFSWRLIMAPAPVIDYVILHEFIHMMEKNHSRCFWDLLESVLPDYRKHRLWLQENGHLLTF